jgi:hypothetical protein
MASVVVHIGAWLRRSKLDAALAHGADPSRSPLLAHRAAALTSERARLKLACWIEEIFATASRPPQPRALQVEPDRTEVWEAASPLAEARNVLASSRPIYAQGVAIVETLLSDGGSAVYRPLWRGELRDRLETAVGALQGRD